MNIDLTTLKSGIDEYLDINEIYSFKEEELKDTDIISLDNLKVTGYISKNSLNEYVIDVDIKGTMVLPCSITLKPVNYDFNTKIEGNLEEIFKEIGKNLENNQKNLDILPIIWENILMEIPMKVVSDDLSDVKTKGDGWELITDEE